MAHNFLIQYYEQELTYDIFSRSKIINGREKVRCLEHGYNFRVLYTEY